MITHTKDLFVHLKERSNSIGLDSKKTLQNELARLITLLKTRHMAADGVHTFSRIEPAKNKKTKTKGLVVDVRYEEVPNIPGPLFSGRGSDVTEIEIED